MHARKNTMKNTLSTAVKQSTGEHSNVTHIPWTLKTISQNIRFQKPVSEMLSWQYDMVWPRRPSRVYLMVCVTNRATNTDVRAIGMTSGRSTECITPLSLSKVPLTTAG